jgi:hypothetical protein
MTGTSFEYHLDYGNIKGHHLEGELKVCIKIAKELKKEIDRFSKMDYSEKLQFFQSYDYLERFLEVKIYNHDSDRKNKIAPLYTFSIFPKTLDDIRQFEKFKTEVLIKENPLEYDLEAIKENHLEKIEKSANPIEYIDLEIEIYKKERGHWKEREGALKTFTEGYSSVVEVRPINYKYYPFCASDFRITLKGIINAQIVPFLEKQKKLIEAQSIQANNTNEVVNIDNDILQVRTKIILFQELGIIECLIERSDTFKNSQTELAKFITELIETNERNKEKTFEAVRTDLRYINVPKDSIPKGKNPKNDTSIKKVNSILSKYGLPIIEQ